MSLFYEVSYPKNYFEPYEDIPEVEEKSIDEISGEQASEITNEIFTKCNHNLNLIKSQIYNIIADLIYESLEKQERIDTLIYKYNKLKGELK